MHATSDQLLDVPPRHPLNESKRLRGRTAELLTLLDAFHRDYAEVANDQILRFELLCDRMFNTFTFDDNPMGNMAPPPSNLDTGDPIAHPFPPLVAALQSEVNNMLVDVHHYYRPGSIDSLRSACLKFLAREDFRGPSPLPDLEVLPGAGTLQLYDSLCKVHIESPGDTILVPELGYGWFLSPPCRIGGRVAAVTCDNRGAVTETALALAIKKENLRSWRDWKRDSDVLFCRAARRLEAEGLVESPSKHDALARVHETIRTTPDAWRSDEISYLLTKVAPRLAAPDLKARALRILRAPRVVAFVHIQPSVTGHIYSATDVHSLARTLHSQQVVAFEDLAYHSIRCRLRDLTSLQTTPAVTYTMLGLSKPMAVANLRLGLLLVDKAHADRANRAIESSTGYVSTILQRALAHALCDDDFDEYVGELSWGSRGYETREKLMYRMLSGETSEIDDLARTVLRTAAAREPILEPLIDDFLRQGLVRWLQPQPRPSAGFYHVVSCEPLLRLPAFRSLGMRRSFDVFAMLAYLFDLRSVPEECMGLGRTRGQRLRLSFSPEPENVGLLFLRAFAGLTAIETAVNASGDAGPRIVEWARREP